MKIGSLFSGIGGLEAGLEQAIGPEAETVWQVEQDEYATRILSRHWPDARRYSDVREVGAHNLERIDVLCGGFPCQDISTAGKQAGLDGEKSGLWSEFARLIGELRPRYAVMENVAAIVTRGMGTVLGDLASLGYDAVWDCIPASFIGAPFSGQGRDRMFIVAFTDSDRCLWPGVSRESEGQLVGSVARGDSPFVRVPSTATGHWEDQPGVRRVADGVRDRSHRIRCLVNAVVPQVARLVGNVVVQLERERKGE